MLPSLPWELTVTEPYLGKNAAYSLALLLVHTKRSKNKPTDAEDDDDKPTTQYQIFI